MINLNSGVKLKTKKHLTIGYLGGSITEGYAASEPSKTSWRALNNENFKNAYKGAEIIEIMASIGGTGSDLAVFRCEEDLLKFNPDLVFVEFAVNDKINLNIQNNRIIRSMEGIVRKIWKHDPYTDIIFIYTTDKNSKDSYMLLTSLLHEKIAKYYDIPSINIGEYLWKKIKKDNRQWNEFFVDDVHPNDNGFMIYAEAIKNKIFKLIENCSKMEIHALGQPIDSLNFENARILDSWSIELKNFKKSNNSLCDRYPHMITASKPGEELFFKFTGRVIGIYWMVAPDSGTIEWKIDDGIWNKISCFDKYAKIFTRANYCILEDKLEYGEHEFTLKISEEKDVESKGHVINIGAFLIC